MPDVIREKVKLKPLLLVLLLAVGCSSNDKNLLPPKILAGCASREIMERELKIKHSERQTAVGVAQDGHSMVSLFSSENGETFTILLAGSNGISCAIAAGHYWSVDK